jgi:hypothetical protein
MERNELRPGWRAWMLLSLRWVVGPLAKGILPSPIVEFGESGFRERLIKSCPESRPLVEQGRSSAVAMMEVLFGEALRGASIQALATYYQVTHSARSIRRQRSFAINDVAELLNSAKMLFEGVRVNDGWAAMNPMTEDDAVGKWVRWFVGINVIAVYQYGIPFPLLLRIAREGEPLIARAALFEALAIEKSVVGLPWVARRVEEATEGHDKGFLKEVAKALQAAVVPPKLRARALDFFLCFFDPWLQELKLAEQANLIREGGFKISEKGLRNRRSRLRLTKAKPKQIEEIPDQFKVSLHYIQNLLGQGPEIIQGRAESMN